MQAHCKLDGVVSLTAVAISGFQTVHVPRIWDSPARRKAERDPRDELGRLARRFKTALEEWTKSVSELATWIRYSPPASGAKPVEPWFEDQSEEDDNKRLYVGYRGAGQAAAFDISNPAQPKLVWEVDMNPPHRGPHTVSPIVYDTVPNFGKAALPRTYAFIVDEAGGAADMAPCPGGVRSASYMLDITTETKPWPVSVWQVPVGNFCEKGGRFGPHQSAEIVNGKINRFVDKLAWIAYFNAGVRIVDLADAYNIKEVGYYIPKTNKNSHPIVKDQKTVIQMNDVDIDHRGLAYASDRVGTGLFVLEYTGRKPTRATS